MRPGPIGARRLGAALLSLVAALALTVAAPVQAAAPVKIGPGIQMVIQGAQCTANFVFRDGAGHTYVGFAAHCAGKGSSTDTDGCTTTSYPIGTRVAFVTGSNLLSAGQTIGYGRLAYSSWTAMHRYHTTNAATCAYNDLALVRVDAASLWRVDPTMPHYGGPTGVAALPAVGAPVYTVGSSSLRGTTAARSATVRARSSWSATVFSLSPGVPGDSGSGFLDAHGRAVGVLSTLAIFPDTGSNGVGSLANELAYAARHGVPGLRLVHGRVAFHG